MPYDISTLHPPTSNDALLRRIERLTRQDAPRYRRLWMYYRNPMLPATAAHEPSTADRPYRQAQEWGLPARVTGVVHSGEDVSASQPLPGIARKEVVIENDIGWRIDTLVEYLMGKGFVVRSAAGDPARRESIERVLSAVLAHDGGTTFFQQVALLGCVYGFVDILVKFDPSPDGAGPSAGSGHVAGPLTPRAETAPDAPLPASPVGPQPGFDDGADTGASDGSPDASLDRIARMVRFEIVEPARALPLLSPADWRVVEAYVQCYLLPRAAPVPSRIATKRSLLHRIVERVTDRFAANHRHASPAVGPGRDSSVLVTEILTATRWQRYEDERLVASGASSLGVVPLVHIQNTPIPFEYGGAGDVEPLVPLQDELNTRLSDRAHRITMQSFKMYLGKGIDNFIDMPVSPGRMWMTENDSADVIEFGGDASCPSEDRHILELREALDKVSSVTPIAAGAIKGRIGRLTSGAALRVTLMALLAKTERKRVTYGEGIARLCELALMWLDHAGVFRTTHAERRVQIHWPNPIPVNQIEQLTEARLKQQVGVPTDVVLRELGY